MSFSRLSEKKSIFFPYPSEKIPSFSIPKFENSIFFSIQKFSDQDLENTVQIFQNLAVFFVCISLQIVQILQEGVFLGREIDNAKAESGYGGGFSTQDP